MSNRVWQDQKSVNQGKTPPPRGIIKWYSHSKRFGYIKMNGGSNGEGKIYFNYASSKKTNPPQIFLEGDHVYFKLINGTRGLKAVEVILVGFKPSKKKKVKNNRKKNNGRRKNHFRKNAAPSPVASNR